MLSCLHDMHSAFSDHRLVELVVPFIYGLQPPPLLGSGLHDVQIRLHLLLPRGPLRLSGIEAEGGHLLLDLRHLLMHRLLQLLWLLDWLLHRLLERHWLL